MYLFLGTARKSKNIQICTDFFPRLVEHTILKHTNKALATNILNSAKKSLKFIHEYSNFCTIHEENYIKGKQYPKTSQLWPKWRNLQLISQTCSSIIKPRRV